MVKGTVNFFVDLAEKDTLSLTRNAILLVPGVVEPGEEDWVLRALVVLPVDRVRHVRQREITHLCNIEKYNLIYF